MEQKKQATTFSEMMQEANQVGAFTAEQVKDLYQLPAPANKKSLLALQERTHRRFKTA